MLGTKLQLSVLRQLNFETSAKMLAVFVERTLAKMLAKTLAKTLPLFLLLIAVYL